MTTLSERGQVQLIVPVDHGTRRAIRDAAVALGISQGAFIAREVDAYWNRKQASLFGRRGKEQT